MLHTRWSTEAWTGVRVDSCVRWRFGAGSGGPRARRTREGRNYQAELHARQGTDTGARVANATGNLGAEPGLVGKLPRSLAERYDTHRPCKSAPCGQVVEPRNQTSGTEASNYSRTRRRAGASCGHPLSDTTASTLTHPSQRQIGRTVSKPFDEEPRVCSTADQRILVCLI
jgi:hypothetical protein